MSKHLWRYTNIPSLIYTLRRRELSLLDFQTWADRNDSNFLSQYKEQKKLKSLLALCFTTTSEKFHHWRVFADGMCGVCIRFDRTKLINALSQPGVRSGAVKYQTIDQFRTSTIKLDRLPFLKRYPYGDEREFRIVFESESELLDCISLKLPLNCISRITLSPWLPVRLSDEIKKAIKEIPGCKKLEVFRSTLLENEQWRRLGCRAK